MKMDNAVDWHTGMAADFDRRYTYDRSFRERYSVWTSLIDKYSRQDMHAIDAGCGSGVFSFYLAKKVRSVIGIDASPEMLRICNEKKKRSQQDNVEFMESDIGALDRILDKKADMVISSSVFEYLDNLDTALDVISGLLVENGLFVLSMPNGDSLYRRLEPVIFKLFGVPRYYQYVKNVHSVDAIRNKLEKSGFKVLESGFYGETPVLSRIMRKVRLSRISDNLFMMVARRV